MALLPRERIDTAHVGKKEALVGQNVEDERSWDHLGVRFPFLPSLRRPAPIACNPDDSRSLGKILVFLLT